MKEGEIELIKNSYSQSRTEKQSVSIEGPFNLSAGLCYYSFLAILRYLRSCLDKMKFPQNIFEKLVLDLKVICVNFAPLPSSPKKKKKNFARTKHIENREDEVFDYSRLM